MQPDSKPSWGNTLAASFLVAGTCIGGGMLALPVATGLSGFIPSLVMLLICFVTMTATGLLLVEASLWMKEGAHMVSMTEELLGKRAKALCWVLYLFIGYGSIVAYTAAGGMEISRVASLLELGDFSKGWSCLLFLLLFGVIVDFGAKVVGRINAILFTGMIAAYFWIIAQGGGEVQPELLSERVWRTSILGIPLILTSFSYQSMVPSLTPYLKRSANALRFAVIGGTTITLFVYVVWQGLVLGIVPMYGDGSLTQALVEGAPVTSYLRSAMDGKWLAIGIDFFSFFAIVTSFLGITLGLFDFLSDGLKIPKKGLGKVALGSLIVVPTLLLAVYFERIFLIALDATGGFGDSILSGIFPALMVWIGRYVQKRNGAKCLIGGKAVLFYLMLFFLFSLGIEVCIHMGFLPSAYDVTDVSVL